jgi:hypothetical protein
MCEGGGRRRRWVCVGGEGEVCVFITAVPTTNLFAEGEGDIGGHVL